MGRCHMDLDHFGLYLYPGLPKQIQGKTIFLTYIPA